MVVCELHLQECDLGQKSILHAVKIKKRVKLPMRSDSQNAFDEEVAEEQGSKPLCETLRDFDSVIESISEMAVNDGKCLSV